MAPCFLVLSDKVLISLFGVLDTISITDKRVLPTKELSHGEPLSAAGTLEKMVLVAAASL